MSYSDSDMCDIDCDFVTCAQKIFKIVQYANLNNDIIDFLKRIHIMEISS